MHYKVIVLQNDIWIDWATPIPNEKEAGQIARLHVGYHPNNKARVVRVVETVVAEFPAQAELTPSLL